MVWERLLWWHQPYPSALHNNFISADMTTIWDSYLLWSREFDNAVTSMPGILKSRSWLGLVLAQHNPRLEAACSDIRLITPPGTRWIDLATGISSSTINIEGVAMPFNESGIGMSCRSRKATKSSTNTLLFPRRKLKPSACRFRSNEFSESADLHRNTRLFRLGQRFHIYAL